MAKKVYYHYFVGGECEAKMINTSPFKGLVTKVGLDSMKI